VEVEVVFAGGVDGEEFLGCCLVIFVNGKCCLNVVVLGLCFCGIFVYWEFVECEVCGEMFEVL